MTDFTRTCSEPITSKPQDLRMCDFCDSGDPPYLIAQSALANLCNFCTQAHCRQKQYAAHKTNMVFDNVEDQTMSSTQEQLIYCDVHKREPLIIFCTSCECLICRSCIVDAHNGHRFAQVDHATRQHIEKQVKDLAECAKHTLGTFQLYLEYTDNVEKQKLNVPEILRREINSAFDSLVTATRARQEVLLSQVKDENDGLFKKIWSEKEHIETIITALKGTVLFSDRSLECGDDTKFLALCSQIIPRLRKLRNAKWDSSSVERIDLTNRVFQFTDLHSQISCLGKIIDKSLTASVSRSRPQLFGSSTSGRLFASLPTETYQATPLKLSLRSHSDLKLGTQVDVKLSIQIRPSMFQTLSVKVIKKISQAFPFMGSTKNSLVSINSRQQGPTGSHLTYSITKFDEISLSFIPVVSGEHQIVVVSQGQSEFVSINIVGCPKSGAVVKRGPHWVNPDSGQRVDQRNLVFGGNKYVRGIVSNNSEEGYVSVLWDNGSEPKLHFWGHNEQYSVQLDL